MPELAEIIEAVRSGRGEEYREIVRRFGDMAFGYAFSILRDVHLAEDATQEAFAQAYENLHALKEPAAFAGWFRRILQGRCARITRRKRIPAVALTAASDVRAELPSPFEAAPSMVSARRRARRSSSRWRLPRGERRTFMSKIPMATSFASADSDGACCRP